MASDGPRAYRLYSSLIRGRVLDVGCLLGNSDHLRDDVDYVGIDCFKDVPDGAVVRAGLTVPDIEKLWAKKEEARPNTKHTRCSAEEYLSPGRTFDTIVCFEVLEHYLNYHEMALWLKGYCRRLLISVPWMEGEEGAKINGHVRPDFSERDFPEFTVIGWVWGRVFLMLDKEIENGER